MFLPLPPLTPSKLIRIGTVCRIRRFNLRTYKCHLSTFLAAIVFLSVVVGGSPAFAQSLTIPTCTPVAQRTGELGCWIMAEQVVGPLTKAQLFWHLDTFSTQEAAMSAKSARGTVITSFGKIWLLSLEEATWSPPAGGRHIATIGPLPVPTASSYTATYMEAVFNPGMMSSIHSHPGPEAFYTVAGETCLETSEGVSFGRLGEPAVIVPGGLPMQLTATGKGKRQGLVLILHDSSMPFSHPVHDWTPKGLCSKK
jgi:quercetin dioxygenase-like cupin family protein